MSEINIYQIIIYPTKGVNKRKIRALLDKIAEYANEADDYEIVIKSRCKGRKMVAIGRTYKMRKEKVEFVKDIILHNVTATIIKVGYI